jgi:hypothetical protein
MWEDADALARVLDAGQRRENNKLENIMITETFAVGPHRHKLWQGMFPPEVPLGAGCPGNLIVGDVPNQSVPESILCFATHRARRNLQGAAAGNVAGCPV